jgi:hypothetical protein
MQCFGSVAHYYAVLYALLRCINSPLASLSLYFLRLELETGSLTATQPLSRSRPFGMWDCKIWTWAQKANSSAAFNVQVKVGWEDADVQCHENVVDSEGPLGGGDEEEVDLEDAQWLPGHVLDVYAGGAETQACLDSAMDMEIALVVVLWHASWAVASEEAESALTRMAAELPEVMFLNLTVDASSDNKKFAFEKVCLDLNVSFAVFCETERLPAFALDFVPRGSLTASFSFHTHPSTKYRARRVHHSIPNERPNNA